MCHMEGWDRYRLGHPAVEVLAEAPRLNAQSGHSKVLHQGIELCCVGTTPLKGGGYKVDKKPNPPKYLMGEPSQAIGQRHQRSGVACFCGLPPFWRAQTPGDRARPLWWKGYRPRVRPTWEPKGTKRNIFFQPDNLGALPALWLQAKLTISLTSIQDKFAKLFHPRQFFRLRPETLLFG